MKKHSIFFCNLGFKLYENQLYANNIELSECIRSIPYEMPIKTPFGLPLFSFFELFIFEELPEEDGWR